MLMIYNSTKFYIYYIYGTSSHKIFLCKQIRFDLFWHSSPVRATAEIKHNKWIIHSWSSRWCSNQQKTRLTNTGWSNCPSCRPLCSSEKQFFLSLILFFKVSNYIKHCYTSDVLVFDFKKTFTYIYLLFFAIITLTFFSYVFISYSFPNFN